MSRIESHESHRVRASHRWTDKPVEREREPSAARTTGARTTGARCGGRRARELVWRSRLVGRGGAGEDVGGGESKSARSVECAEAPRAARASSVSRASSVLRASKAPSASSTKSTACVESVESAESKSAESTECAACIDDAAETDAGVSEGTIECDGGREGAGRAGAVRCYRVRGCCGTVLRWYARERRPEPQPAVASRGALEARADDEVAGGRWPYRPPVRARRPPPTQAPNASARVDEPDARARRRSGRDPARRVGVGPLSASLPSLPLSARAGAGVGVGAGPGVGDRRRRRRRHRHRRHRRRRIAAPRIPSERARTPDARAGAGRDPARRVCVGAPAAWARGRVSAIVIAIVAASRRTRSRASASLPRACESTRAHPGACKKRARSVYVPSLRAQRSTKSQPRRLCARGGPVGSAPRRLGPWCLGLTRAFDAGRSGLVESLTRADGCETVAGRGGWCCAGACSGEGWSGGMGEMACGGVSWRAGWLRRMDEVTDGPTRRGDAQTRGFAGADERCRRVWHSVKRAPVSASGDAGDGRSGDGWAGALGVMDAGAVGGQVDRGRGRVVQREWGAGWGMCKRRREDREEVEDRGESHGRGRGR
ncbi:hypothetical protein HETIRDRAFT_446972, partial [Heterobasidion irregulare TC 32-1]